MTSLTLMHPAREVTTGNDEPYRPTMARTDLFSFNRALTWAFLGGTITIYH